jgi:hypothetical protein
MTIDIHYLLRTFRSDSPAVKKILWGMMPQLAIQHNFAIFPDQIHTSSCKNLSSVAPLPASSRIKDKQQDLYGQPS